MIDDYERNEILVADDTPANLKLLENLLQDAGYNVRVARDGESALRSIASQLPDLIVLDMNMPDIAGAEVCRRVKANPQTREIPIIFISVLEDEQAKISAFQAGGVDYINTPFSEAEVLARVQTHLRLRQAQKKLERRHAEQLEIEERLHAELGERKRADAELQQEIMEYKKVARALKASEEKFYKMFHFSPIAMSLSTLEDGCYVDVNAEFLRLSEWTREEVIGRRAAELNIWILPEQRQLLINRIKARGFVNNVELHARTKSGKILVLLWSADRISIDGIEYLLISAHDVTERKRNEERIKEQLRELRSWHAATLNRELRIIELKQEINAILTRFGEPSRYQLTDGETLLQENEPPDSEITPATSEITLPEEAIQKWQAMVDLISEIFQTPAALIMKVEPPEIQVFVSSRSPNNPYHAGERAALNTGLYCETVMATRSKLLVPNALKSSQWDHNPDIARGMISYLGFPIIWPNGEIFGTICTLDQKENPYNDLHQQLLLQFRQAIEADLKYLRTFHVLLTEEKQGHRRESAQARRALLSMLEDARHTEAALQESEARYRQIVETSQEGVWLIDLQGKTLYINQRMAEMLGYTMAEVLERPFFEFLDPLQYQEAQLALKRRRDGIAEITERCFIRKDGSKLWTLNSASPIRDQEGHIVCSMGMLTDITDRKQAEQELRRLNAYNRSLIEVSLDPLVTIGADGKITDVNTATEVATGHTRTVLIGTDFSDYFTEPERARAGYQKVFREGLVRDYPLELRHRDGHVTSVLYNAVVYRDEAGEVLGVFAAARDITEQKQNDARVNALLRLNQMSDASIAQIADFAMDEGIFMTGSTMGFLIFLNDDETVGTVHAWSKHAMAECAILDKPMRFVIAETGLWGDVIRQRRPIILNDYAAPHPSKKGFPPGHVAISRYLSIPVFDASRIVVVAAVANKHAAYTDNDIRQLQLFMDGMWNIVRRKQTEEELRRAKEALETANAQLQELNASKDTFFSIIAHDLKNPLNSFLAFAEILEQLQEYSPRERQEMIKQFRASADHLFALLDNLLTWARSQQGRLPYTPQVLHLNALTALVLELVRPYANRKQIQLISTIPEGLCVTADLDMLETIARNLLTNAIKFTPNGGCVTVSAEQKEDAVEIAVSDTGVGIPAEKVAELFQLGAKTKQIGTNGEKGTGLGLILCKEFVERHGGTIRCESLVEQGSVFRLTLPIPQEKSA